MGEQQQRVRHVLAGSEQKKTIVACFESSSLFASVTCGVVLTAHVVAVPHMMASCCYWAGVAGRLGSGDDGFGAMLGAAWESSSSECGTRLQEVSCNERDRVIVA
jgi:hypothetical protein